MHALKKIKSLFARVLQDNNEKDMLESILALMPGHVYWINDQGFYLGCNHNQVKSAELYSSKDILRKKTKKMW
jgi:two-component system aerobic respiration control sensor histidine kinase ArcB